MAAAGEVGVWKTRVSLYVRLTARPLLTSESNFELVKFESKLELKPEALNIQTLFNIPIDNCSCSSWLTHLMKFSNFLSLMGPKY